MRQINILFILATFFISFSLADMNSTDSFVSTVKAGTQQPAPVPQYTCKNHPAFMKSYLQISQIVANYGFGKQTNALFSAYKKTTPTNRTATELGVCSQYAGQSTCCDSNLIQLIDKAALLKVKPIQQAQNAFQKMVSLYVKKFNKLCPTKSVATFNVNDIFTNKTLSKFQDMKRAQKDCKINFATAISSYTRGAMCTICAGIDKVGDIFNKQGQLLVSPDSMTVFQKATNDAISCTGDLLNPDKLDGILNELNSAYITNKTETCGQNVTAAVKEFFKKNEIKNDDGKGFKLCSGTFVYGNNFNCENALLGPMNIEKGRLLRSEYLEKQRLLANSSPNSVVTPDAISDPNGVNLYLTSTTDSAIDENGLGITANFSNINIPASKSNTSKLAFISFFGILVFLI